MCAAAEAASGVAGIVAIRRAWQALEGALPGR